MSNCERTAFPLLEPKEIGGFNKVCSGGIDKKQRMPEEMAA